MDEFRSTVGVREWEVTHADILKTNEQFIADLFVHAGLVASRREFREVKKNLQLRKLDEHTLLLGRLKKGHLQAARFIDLV